MNEITLLSLFCIFQDILYSKITKEQRDPALKLVAAVIEVFYLIS